MAADPANIPVTWIWVWLTNTARPRTITKLKPKNPLSIMPNPKSQTRPNSDSAGLLSEVARKITHYMQAGYPGLYIVSPEEQRVEADIKAAAKTAKFGLYV